MSSDVDNYKKRKRKKKKGKGTQNNGHFQLAYLMEEPNSCTLSSSIKEPKHERVLKLWQFTLFIVKAFHKINL